MSSGNLPLYAFNRGLISKYGLARTDLKRLALSAEVMTNWMPRPLGAMSLRPGLDYLSTVGISGGPPKHLPFIFAVDDTALIQLGEYVMRVLVDEALVTRVAVSTVIANGNFTTDLSGWTSADQAGCTSAWAFGGYMSLTGTLLNQASRYQSVTVNAADIGVRHALRIIVNRGPIILRVGLSLGSDEYIAETTLNAGTHSLAFTPIGGFYVQFSALQDSICLLDSCNIEAAGVMEVPTIWPASVLPLIRYDQSADVFFVALDGYRQQKIERRDTDSWSVVDFKTSDGPFRTQNFGGVRLAPSALSGDITITASQPYFRASLVGALYRIQSSGQQTSNVLAGAAQAGDYVEITGLRRQLSIDITGAFVGTIDLQRSVSAPGAWVNVGGGQSWTAPVSTTYNDTLDNEDTFYRLNMSAYTSGSATTALTYHGGSINGIAEITGYTTNMIVSARVWKHFGGLTATTVWWEGIWSPHRGYPTCTRLYQGRLFWFGRDYIIGSVSGAYGSYDDTQEGDSGPLIEQIGSGAVDKIFWAIGTQRLVIGAETREISVRSSAINEPLTPTDFNIVDLSTYGSAPIDAVKIDTEIFFIQGARMHVIKMKYQPSYFGLDYSGERQTEIDPDIALEHGGFQQLVVQRKPATRLHARLGDGQVAIFVYDQAEDVQAWVLHETTGNGVIDMAVLPGGDGDIEDKVYYIVDTGA